MIALSFQYIFQEIENILLRWSTFICVEFRNYICIEIVERTIHKNSVTNYNIIRQLQTKKTYIVSIITKFQINKECKKSENSVYIL